LLVLRVEQGDVEGAADHGSMLDSTHWSVLTTACPASSVSVLKLPLMRSTRRSSTFFILMLFVRLAALEIMVVAAQLAFWALIDMAILLSLLRSHKS
jgi:hypothetical protein